MLTICNAASFVLAFILGLLKDPVRVGQVLGIHRMTANVMNTLSKGCDRLAKAIGQARKAKTPEVLKSILRPLIRRVDVSLYEVGITLDPAKLTVPRGHPGNHRKGTKRRIGRK